MNTVWLESASRNQLSSESSTEDTSTGDKTRVRATPPPNVQSAPRQSGEVRADDSDPEVEELPISRLMLSQGRSPITGTKAPPAALAQDRPPGLLLTALTTDTTFAKQLRAALDHSHEVQVVANEDAAAELATAGRCPILITDIAMPRSALDALTTRLRSHDPATAIIVAGNRDQGGMFIGLQSSGAVDGFLLKPVTTAATQLVIEAATRRYRTHGTEASTGASRRLRQRSHGRKERSTPGAHDDMDGTETIEAKRAPVRTEAIVPPPQTAHVIATAPQRIQRPSWLLVAIVALGAAGAVGWFATQRTTGIDPNEMVAKHLALADRAFTAGRLLDSRDGAVRHYQTVLAVDSQNFAARAGLDRIAQELSRQTQAHMAQQRLADAALSLERLRELQPDYPELPLLDSQLQLVQNTVLASRTPTLAAPPTQQAVPPATPTASASRRAPSSDRVKPSSIEATKAPAAEPTAITAATTPALIESSNTKDPAKSAPDQQSTQSQSIAPASASAETPNLQSGALEPASAEQLADGSQLVDASQLADASSTRVPDPTQTQSMPPPAPVAPEALETTPTKSNTPALLKYVPPIYPADAFARRMEGWVEVSMEIAPNGNVLETRIENGEKRQLFGRAALTAVRQWKYAPDATRAAGVRSSVRLEFKLD